MDERINLRKEMQSKIFGEKEVVKLGIDLCEQLIVFQRSGEKHADIIPDNIYLGEEGYEINELTSDIRFDGYVESFYAPEKIHMSVSNELTDEYALAMIMYQLLNGNRPPFATDIAEGLSEEVYASCNSKRLEGMALPKPMICESSELADTVLKGCDFYPEKRYSTIYEFESKLKKCYNDILQDTEDEALMPNQQTPQAPRQQMPPQMMPNQQMPRQQMPPQMMPNQQMPNQQMPPQMMPNQQMPRQQMPPQMPPNQQMPRQQMSRQQMPPQMIPNQQVPRQQMPPQMMPKQQVPRQQMPPQMMPNQRNQYATPVPPKKSKSMWPLIILLILAVIGLIVAIVVILNKPDGDSDEKTELTTYTTTVPMIDLDDVYTEEKTTEETTESTTENTSEQTTEKEPAECPKEYEQYVSVQAASGSTDATLRVYNWENGKWIEKFSCKAKVGVNGIGSNYGEGKKVTPMGTYKLGIVLTDNPSLTEMPTYEVTSSTCVVDDVNSPLYNQICDINSLSEDVSYDKIGNNIVEGKLNAAIFIEHNGDGFSSENVVPGNGSVITICGVTRTPAETLGCIDISSTDMAKLLKVLNPDLNPYIEITVK